jgi:hypothetical protein
MVILGCAAIGGEGAPGFIWRHDLGDSDMVDISQLIVVGEVESLGFVGSDVIGTDDQGNTGPWRLQKVRVRVEGVIKGVHRNPKLEFLFYVWLGGTSGDWNSLREHHRYVFFLTKEKGTIRAVRDYWRSSIEVGSGYHSIPASARTPKERIALLLLTPGQDMQASGFRRTLSRAVSLGVEWLGECRTLRLLSSLRVNGNSVVRESVLDQLTSRNWTSCSADQDFR